MENNVICVKKLGQELRRLRLQTRPRMSQQYVADRLGIHRNTLMSYEAGSDMPAMMFLRLCALLNGNVAEILERVIAQPQEPAAVQRLH